MGKSGNSWIVPYLDQPFVTIVPSEPAAPLQGGTAPPGPGAATRRPPPDGRTNAIVVGSAGLPLPQ